MIILFLSYWGINEGLAQATVLPHVEILSRHPLVKHIILASVERSNFVPVNLSPNIEHVPLKSKKYRSILLTKIFDFVTFTKRIERICTDQKIDLIICRSSLAGALGYLVWRRKRIPYIVESFEPHAQYMLESGVWGSFDPRYWIQLFFEGRQKKSATYLLPVAENYKEVLFQQGIQKDKIITMPCCLDVEYFSFSALAKQNTRTELSIEMNALVGIYVGKFGGIYYEKEAFDLFEKCFLFFGSSFHLIVLTDYEQKKLLNELEIRGLDKRKIHIRSVPHNEVRLYLSASDLAFSFYRKSPAMKYLSPIKIGEYWANGLPVLIEDGIGDDSAIVAKEGVGIIFEIPNFEFALTGLKALMANGREEIAKKIEGIAIKYRSLSLVADTYDYILKGRLK